MTRPVSNKVRRALYANNTNKLIIVLVTVNHPSLTDPIRVSSDVRESIGDGPGITTSRGEDFICYPFKITLPEDRDDQTVQAQIEIDNISLDLVRNLLVVEGEPTVKFEIVLADDPDTVEAGPWNFTLTQADGDVFTITGTLSYEDILNRPFPGRSVLPSTIPGVFR